MDDARKTARAPRPRAGPSRNSPPNVRALGSNPIGVLAQRWRESGRSRPTLWARQCAKGGHSATAARTSQIDPKATFRLGPMNGREAQEIGPGLKVATSWRGLRLMMLSPTNEIHCRWLVPIRGFRKPLSIQNEYANHAGEHANQNGRVHYGRQPTRPRWRGARVGKGSICRHGRLHELLDAPQLNIILFVRSL
jgi:hypothetical protein